MKKIIKTSIVLLSAMILFNCSSSNKNNNNCEECTYTISSSEKAGTVPSSLNGIHNLTFDYPQSGSPFIKGTKAIFTIDNNKLTVEIDGKCITIKNPIQTSPSENTFKDTCRDKLTYAVSTNQNGGLNEINVGSVSGTWFGQFKI